MNKILFFADFLCYGETGQSITGFQYQRLQNGPAPKRLVPVRDRMVQDGDLAIQTVPLRNGRTQHRTINLRKPDLSVFTADEISLVDSLISALTASDAKGVSDLSHRTLAWQVALEGKIIPYETIFLSNQPLSEAEIVRGREIAKQVSSRSFTA